MKKNPTCRRFSLSSGRPESAERSAQFRLGGKPNDARWYLRMNQRERFLAAIVATSSFSSSLLYLGELMEPSSGAHRAGRSEDDPQTQEIYIKERDL